MIPDKELTQYRTLLEEVIKEDGLSAIFDHYAIKVPNTDTYEQLCTEYGKAVNEVEQSGRNVATVVGPLGTFEIMEPKANENITEPTLDHLGFCVESLAQVVSIYGEHPVIALGNTEFVFVRLEDELVQFRTLPLAKFKNKK